MHSSKERILKAAVDLFSQKGIDEVSISQIVREARVSNSTFYKFFRGKDALIEGIFKMGIDMLDDSLKIRGFTRESKLVRLIEDYIYFVQENLEICKVLHEAEFTFMFIPRRIKNVLMKKLTEIGLEVSNELFWFVWGTTRFLTMWKYFWNGNTSENPGVSLLDFIWNGFDPDEHRLDTRVFEIEVTPMEMDVDTTKSKLLSSAERLFAKNGFRKTQIYDITRGAGVGLGTYYLYFETKNDILKELVSRINRALRHTIKKAISGIHDRRDAEIAGYYAFLRFFKVHPGIYRIVREAEFILPNVAIDYYEKIHTRYLPPLKRAMESGELLRYPPEDLAVFLMGIGHFMGEDLIFHMKTNERKALVTISRLLYRGLKGLGR